MHGKCQFSVAGCVCAEWWLGREAILPPESASDVRENNMNNDQREVAPRDREKVPPKQLKIFSLPRCRTLLMSKCISILGFHVEPLNVKYKMLLKLTEIGSGSRQPNSLNKDTP